MRLFIIYLADKINRKDGKLILIENNLNTNNGESLIETFGDKMGKRISIKIERYFTQKHASLLNQAEIEIHPLRQQCLNRCMEIFQKMQSELAACARKRNKDKCGIN